MSKPLRFTICFLLGLSLTAAAATPGPPSGMRLTTSAKLPSSPGLDFFKVETPAATYYLDKLGGAIASLVDRDGHDWISFRSEPFSRGAGEFRGFPNAIGLHPLNRHTVDGKSQVSHESRDRVTILVESGNGLWHGRYDFFAMHCQFTMTRMPPEGRYWILYEGTPGGSYDDTDWWMTSAIREKQPLTTTHDGDIPAPEWIAFGDRRLERSLFLLHHEDDEFVDTFWQLDRQMTVFGFGRRKPEMFLKTVPQRFSIGLLETTDHAAIDQVMRRMLEQAGEPSATPKANDWKDNLARGTERLTFRHRTLAGDGGRTQVGDIDGDGRNDVVTYHSQSIAWLEYPEFKRHPIRQGAATGKFGTFAGDRFALADMDGDIDLDVVVGKGREETNFQIVWYENPGPRMVRDTSEWKEHLVGTHGRYIKDLMVADIDRDGAPDVVARTHPYTTIYFQERDGTWPTRKIEHPPKEGMALADLDQDRDIDIVLNGIWLETPDDPRHGEYRQHTIAEKWFTQNSGVWTDNCCYVAVGDLDGDGLTDVILSHSEKIGWPIAWYSVPSAKQAKTGPWEEHILTSQFDWCETLHVGDVDGDGSLDVVASEFETPENKDLTLTNAPPFPVVIFFNAAGDGTKWIPQRIGDTGTYAAVLGDVGSDGDLDVVGPHTFFTWQVNLWENLAADRTSGSASPRRSVARPSGKHPLDRWQYLQVDNQRTKRFFGLALGDATGDGRQDIAAGQWFYRNPGGDMSAKWERVELPGRVDSLAILDVNGNDRGDIIAAKASGQYWLEADDREGTSWKARQIGSLPLGSHQLGPQLYTTAQIVPGGRPEIVLGAAGTWYLEIPENPERGPWPATRVTAEGAGNAVGDFDGDGLIDIAGSIRGEGRGEILPGSRGARRDNSRVLWWKNPGTGKADWQSFEIGYAAAADRFVAADLNGDGHTDLVISEERFPGSVPNANLLWFENPGAAPRGNWKRHVISTQFSMNSLEVADFDGDGDVDLVTCEHRMPSTPGEPLPERERLQIWENDGRGNFTARTIDTGKESHLGARVADLDGDGDHDIVSIAWRNFQFLHVWRNEAMSEASPRTKDQRPGTRDQRPPSHEIRVRKAMDEFRQGDRLGQDRLAGRAVRCTPPARPLDEL